MQLELGNCIIKSDAYNWVVEVWGDVQKEDGSTKRIKKDQSYPSSLKRAISICMYQGIRESESTDIKEFTNELKRIEEKIDDLFGEVKRGMIKQ